MYAQSELTPPPSTAVLEESQERVTNANVQWIRVYRALLNAIAIAAGVTIILVKTGIVNVGDQDAQDDWTEAASQVANGVFMWKALTSHPVYMYRTVLLSRLLKGNSNLAARVRTARYLSEHFPLAFVDTSDNTVTQRRGVDVDAYMTSDNKPVVCLGNIVFLRDDAKYLRNTFFLLNCGCLFQYVMTGFMWGYDADSRPGFVLPALLPPIILCGVLGEYRLKLLSKKDRRDVIGFSLPVLGALSVTRHSMSLL